jgi:hypothetical protein
MSHAVHQRRDRDHRIPVPSQAPAARAVPNSSTSPHRLSPEHEATMATCKSRDPSTRSTGRCAARQDAITTRYARSAGRRYGLRVGYRLNNLSRRRLGAKSPRNAGAAATGSPLTPWPSMRSHGSAGSSPRRGNGTRTARSPGAGSHVRVLSAHPSPSRPACSLLPGLLSAGQSGARHTCPVT